MHPPWVVIAGHGPSPAPKRFRRSALKAKDVGHEAIHKPDGCRTASAQNPASLLSLVLGCFPAQEPLARIHRIVMRCRRATPRPRLVPASPYWTTGLAGASRSMAGRK